MSWKQYVGVLLWVPWILVQAVLILLGLVIVPVALALWRWSQAAGEPVTWWPGLFFLWGNDSIEWAAEGVPDWWLKRAAAGTEGRVARWFPRWWWYAIRNPVANSRYIFSERDTYRFSGNWHQADMEPATLVQLSGARAGDSRYRWAWSGFFVGFRWVKIETLRPVFENSPAGEIVGTYSEFWLGWKVGSEVPGMGFAMQWRRNREIGR